MHVAGLIHSYIAKCTDSAHVLAVCVCSNMFWQCVYAVTHFGRVCMQ